jgi:transposase
MFVDTSKSKQNGKIYVRHLIRDSYRDKGTVKHRTIANISQCTAEEIKAIKLGLKHKGALGQVGSIKGSFRTEQGLSVGAVWTLFETAKKLGIVKALGQSENGKLALWQVLARVIDQGSRLSAVRLAGTHAACDILGLEKFNEDDLYKNLDWLTENQSKIEDNLVKGLYPNREPELFLYDVTSSYFEGTENELAMFGYNRDGKRGKKQIVIGLLCDKDGEPLSVEVFEGNTQDPKTVSSQLKKIAERFGGVAITLVGDRGMIKSKEIEDILDHSFHYITAITKPQIEKMLKQNIFKMSLFDQTIAEVETDDGTRYVLRRNPVRADEIRKTRADKLNVIMKLIKSKNEYLQLHPRATESASTNEVTRKLSRLKVAWAKAEFADRTISLVHDEALLSELSKLDGCYVLKTDLSKDVASKEIVHARYKDLAFVESAFRDSKTEHLQLRPIYVRLTTRTRGHVLVVMLAYKIIRHLANAWITLDKTVEEGVAELAQLCATSVIFSDVCYNAVPAPRATSSELLKLADVIMPAALPSKNVKVSTRKRLPENRRIA